MDIRLNCPVCGKGQSAPEGMVGSQVQCSGCGAVFTAVQGTGQAAGQPPAVAWQSPAPAPHAASVAATAPPTPKMSGLAIASLTLGAAGLLTCGVTALVGLILGIVALSQINRSRGQLAGKQMAVAGVTVSAVFTLIGPMIGLMLSTAALGRAGDEARKVRCLSNLVMIAKCADLWLMEYGDEGFYPSSLKTLRDDYVISEPKTLLCPARGTRPVPGQFTTDYECILDMAGRKVAEADAPSWMPLAWDKKGNHSDGRCVVFFDSHGEFMVGDDFERRWLPRIMKWVEDIKAAKHPPAGNLSDF